MVMPRKHIDAAARQQAYRDRRASDEAAGAVALTILKNPTPKLLSKIVREMLSSGKAGLPEICAAVVEGVRESNLAIPAHTGADLEQWIIEKSQS